VEDDVQQGAVNAQCSVVFNKPEFAEAIHKEAYPGAGCAFISASVSWLILGITVSGAPSLSNWTSSGRARARRFSLDLKR
jgi:hypothetical protein